MDNVEILNYIKSELKNYKYLKHLQVRLHERITELKHARDGLPSPNYDGVRIENHYSEVNPITVIDEQIANTELMLCSVSNRIEVIDNLINGMDKDTANVIERLYIYKLSTIDGLALECGMSEQNLKTKINNELLYVYTYYMHGLTSS